jgi:hypothetical protein
LPTLHALGELVSTEHLDELSSNSRIAAERCHSAYFA